MNLPSLPSPRMLTAQLLCIAQFWERRRLCSNQMLLPAHRPLSDVEKQYEFACQLFYLKKESEAFVEVLI
jgi:hypothetical protein